MKQLLIVFILLISYESNAQVFNPKTQGIYFKTKQMDVVEYLNTYSKYRDSSAASIYALKKIPFLQWSITSKSVYLRKEGGEAKKIGKVIEVIERNFTPLAIEYTYVLKRGLIKIYYSLETKEFMMIEFNGTLYSIDEQPEID